LAGLGIGHGGNAVKAGVLGQGEGDLFQSIGESPHSVLFHCGNSLALFLEMEGTGHLGGAAAVNDLVAFDQIADGAEGIVDTASGFVDDLVAAAAHEDGQGLGFGTFLDDQHTFVGGAEVEFLNLASEAELLRGDFLEAGDDAGASGHGDEFDILASDPTDGREFVLKKEMVGLVVETPLAQGDRGARVLHDLDHIYKVFLFLLI
jgi:hypothetical protein